MPHRTTASRSVRLAASAAIVTASRLLSGPAGIASSSPRMPRSSECESTTTSRRVRRIPSAAARMAMSVAARTFQPADYDAVLRLWSEAGFRIGPSETRAGIELKRRRDPDLFLVAAVDETIEGAVLGGFDGRRGWVYHLAVAPGYRNRGV